MDRISARCRSPTSRCGSSHTCCARRPAGSERAGRTWPIAGCRCLTQSARPLKMPATITARSARSGCPGAGRTERLGPATVYWLATLRPDAPRTFAQSTPWSTALVGGSPRPAGLATYRPRCVTCPDPTGVVILEGNARQVSPNLAERLAVGARKYESMYARRRSLLRRQAGLGDPARTRDWDGSDSRLTPRAGSSSRPDATRDERPAGASSGPGGAARCGDGNQRTPGRAGLPSGLGAAYSPAAACETAPRRRAWLAALERPPLGSPRCPPRPAARHPGVDPSAP